METRSPDDERMLCQLDAEIPFRAELERWLPGFGEESGRGAVLQPAIA